MEVREVQTVLGCNVLTIVGSSGLTANIHTLASAWTAVHGNKCNELFVCGVLRGRDAEGLIKGTLIDRKVLTFRHKSSILKCVTPKIFRLVLPSRYSVVAVHSSLCSKQLTIKQGQSVCVSV